MLKNRLLLIFLSWILYGGSIFLYTHIPYYIKFLRSEHYHFLIQNTLFLLLWLYNIYILFFKKDFPLEKERLYITLCGIRNILQFLLSAMQKKLVLSADEKVSLLLFLVKFYFVPIMAVFALNNLSNVVLYTKNIPPGFSLENILLLYFPLVLSLIFLIDVSYYLTGYLVESTALGNKVLSVESTAFGWLVTLACYPPFNRISEEFLGWHSKNFNDFGNIYISIIMGGIALLLMSFYLWATISLGGKASNLTNRGIVTTGAYGVVRHPSYAAKNLTWWIMGIPFIFSPQILSAYSNSTFIHFVLNDLPKAFIPLLSLCAWSGIYYLRAITEERHLSKYPDYQIYAEKVRYRFIPKVF